MRSSILSQLREEYARFTAAEKKIADYILANQWECQGFGIAELSSECGVAVSTVSVFCRKLGLAGFNDFKLELARANTLTADHAPTALSNTIPECGDSVRQVMQKACQRGQEILERSHRTLSADQAEKAVDLICRAGQVLMLGQGNHNAMASMAWAQFAVTSSKFKVVTDSHYQVIALSTLSKDDVVIYFSFTGATEEVMDAVEIIRRVGARLVLVTRFANSPAAEAADAVLICGGDDGLRQFASGDALISQLYVIQSLVGCYQLRLEATEGENV